MNTIWKPVLLYLAMLPFMPGVTIAQQQAPEPHPATTTDSKPPTITDAQKASYWKAVAQQQGSQKQLDAANAGVAKVVQEMVAACGSEATLVQASNGDPECVAKPVEQPKK